MIIINLHDSVFITGEWTITKTNINMATGLPISRSRIKLKNKITNSGLSNMAALLVGEVPSDTAAMHIVLGNNATLAQDDDTIVSMGEVFRSTITAKSHTGGTVRLRIFLQTSDANGDHACMGVVARSTDVPESGELINRLVQPFSKASNQVLTVECRIIFRREVSS